LIEFRAHIARERVVCVLLLFSSFLLWLHLAMTATRNGARKGKKKERKEGRKKGEEKRGKERKTRGKGSVLFAALARGQKLATELFDRALPLLDLLLEGMEGALLLGLIKGTKVLGRLMRREHGARLCRDFFEEGRVIWVGSKCEC